MCSPSCGGVSTSSPRMTLSCAQDNNASGLAAAATSSASPAGLAPAVSLARAGAAPTTGGTPPHLCASTLKGLACLTSASLAIAAGLGALWIAGTLFSADNTPPNSCRASSYRSGGFQVSGRQASVVHCSMAVPSLHGKSGGSQLSGQMLAAHHSEAAPSLGRFSRVRVLDGDKKGEAI